MSIWVRALCTKSLDGLTPADLRDAIAARLPTLAALYGEDDAEPTLARLVVEDAKPSRPFAVWNLRYRGDDTFVRVERWTNRDSVREETGELLERLEDCDEDEADDVRALLGDVVEAVGIELKMSDVEGIGWAVAIAAAACFAERGAGLIQADGEGYLEPRGREVAQVLDGD
jgi:hypothetical protein